MKNMDLKKGIKIATGAIILSSLLLIVLSFVIRIENDEYKGADFSPLFHCLHDNEINNIALEVKPTDIFTMNDLLSKESSCGYDEAVYEWEDQDTITFEVEVTQAGSYHSGIEYLSLNESVLDNAITVTINGDLQSSNAENMRLPTSWTNESQTIQFDSYNNQVLSRQTPLYRWDYQVLRENLMLFAEPVTFDFNAGVNEVTIQKEAGHFLMGSVYLLNATEFDDYDTYLNQHQGPDIENVFIPIGAEQSTFKNDISIRYESERSLSVSPYASDRNYINVVGNYFHEPGQKITYAFEVEEAGFYNLSLKYKNDYYQNVSSFRNIYVNGVIPFDAMHGYAFDYSPSWRNETLNHEGEAYRFYFEEGLNTVSFEVDGSLNAAHYYRIMEMMDEITQLSLDINKLTGGVQDRQREWNLDRYLPEAYESLEMWSQDVERMIEDLRALNTNPNRSNQIVRKLENTLSKLEELKADHNRLPNNMNLLSEGSGSIARTLAVVAEEITTVALSMDSIYIHSEDTNLPTENANIFARLITWVQRVLRVANIDQADDDVIEIWVNRSRFYVDLMQQMADSEFTPETGIKVKFSVMPDEQKLIMANAAGTQPDLALGVSGWLPYELGLRGAAADLREYDGFYDVLDQFAPGSILHMMHDDKVYGLPETQDFSVTIYRTDILEQVNVEVPETYDDIIDMLPTLQRFGMNYYLPLSAEAGLKPFAATAPFIYQFNGALYSEDAMRTGIDQEASIEAINMMVDLYTIYSLPLQTPNFYDVFRSGRIPIGTANFDTYIRLLFAAPELVNKWDIALAPGVMQEDGTINRDNPGTAQSVLMFEKSDRKDDAWQFIKWWLSTEVQSDFTYDLQSIYGREFMWNSANIEAFKTLPISENHIDVITSQWDHLREVPKTPGGYIIERELSNIWNTVVFDSENVRVAVDDSVTIINRELRRKYLEFSYVDDRGNMVKPYILPRLETVESWLEDYKEE